MKLIFGLLFLFITLFVPRIVSAQEASPLPDESLRSSYYQAHVIRVTEQTSDDNQTQEIGNVEVRLKFRGGDRDGQEVTTWWSNNQQVSRFFQVKEGQTVLIACVTFQGNESCNIVDQVRSTGLIILLTVFLLAVWLVTRRHGLRAILSMGLGLVVILFVIIPLIIKGLPPLPVTLLGGLAILIPSIYISHGFNTKSHIALIAITLAVIIVSLLSLTFSNVLHLTGSTGEETNYLNPSMSLRAILFSGIVLGALGVIDDIAMTQVAIVNELYHSGRKMTSVSLFKRAMRVGRDHIASVINTLFLAYAGIALPLLILIEQNHLPAFVALQQEPIATEIMRTLVGTIGLILVVPLTSFIAAEVITRYPHRFPPEEHHHIH